MKLLDVAREVRRHLQENGRVSLRMLRRDYELGDEALEELIEELVDVQQIARREGNLLVWAGQPAAEPGTPRPATPATPSLPQRGRPTEQAETRKIISIIFADLMGSTALQEGLDPESVNRVMDAYYQAVRGPVEAAGGTVVQLLGDGVLCAFGIPTIAEDDALRAVRAAMGVQQAFREFLGTQQWLSVPIGLRVAVNTGEVVVSDEHPAGIGDPLNVAARLQQEARDGEVLIGQATRRLVADAVTLEQAGVFALKGRAETVAAYRVLSLERPKGAATAAFVGREDEMARLTAVYEAALVTPAARLAVLVGSPGLGKSRLIAEVARRLGDDATVVTAHCDAVGGATFAPVAEALREWLVSDASHGSHGTQASHESHGTQFPALDAVIPEGPERARIIAGISALLAGSPASPEETFFVIRRLLTALAHSRPVVLVIDDLHWAEPLLLDLVEHLIQWGSGVPLFVLIGARPELRNLRSSLVTPSGLVSEVVTLAGLDAGAAMRLAANVIGASDLPAAVAAKVLATSEGNPLFVGELVRMLVDEGAIERQGERWVVGANLAALEMPPTIHALLSARIERLRPDDRTVLERAAVVGRHFSRGAVSALLGRNGSELDARLEALRRTELIEGDSGWFLGEPVLRFHHVLIRDAAYRRLLKGTRAELHERLADWIEAQVGDVAEHDETIGWHLEQAHQHLRELGPMDAQGRELGARAAQRLAAAGRRALGRDDLPVAADLLGRAVHRLDADDPARADLALDWCEALLAAGDVGRAQTAIDELGRFAELKGLGTGGWGLAGEKTDGPDPSSSASPQPLAPSPHSGGRSGRLSAWHTCFASQLTVLTAPQGLQAAADAVAAAARELAALGDAAGEAKAHSVHATALARLGKVGACEAALDQALAAARRAGDRRRANAVLAGAPLAALWGPSPVTRASGRCLDVVRVLRITQGAPAVESVALSCQGVLEALRGRTEAARRMLASSRKMVEDLGIANRLFEADVFAGRIASMEGDTATAERLLRGAYEGLRDLGLGIDAARAGALLARTLLSLDRVDAAEALSHESEALAGDDLQAAIAWRGVRAEALARRGEHGAAIELAKAAVAIASATDALLDHADARVALAVALRAAGRGSEADLEERRAIELWEAKGATLLAERARRSPTAERRDHNPAADRREGDAPRDHKAPREGEAPAEPSAARGGSAGASPSREVPPTRRRVRANAAAENAARLYAALAAVDLDAAARQLGDSLQVMHHPTGLTYDGPALLESLRRMFETTRGLAFRHEALATLGDSLCLSRQWMSFDSADDAALSFGAAELETLMLGEVDATGRRSRTEIFAIDHLGEAIARLYERHAELLPEGPERERAAATARSVEVMLRSPDDVDRVATVIAPSFESVDHRPLSTWSMRGGGAFLEHLRALHEVAAAVFAPDIEMVDHRTIGTWVASGVEAVAGHFASIESVAKQARLRDHDVLAAEDDALLVVRTHSGVDRQSGGAYERRFQMLIAAGADGRLARIEWFEEDREAEALARFEDLTCGVEVTHVRGAVAAGLVPAGRGIRSGHEGRSYTRTEERTLAPQGRRRVRANAATRGMERFESVLAARDGAALAEVFAESLDVLHHPTRATYGRREMLGTWRSMMRAERLDFRSEILASLGGALALEQHFLSVEGLSEAHLAGFGRSEFDEVVLIETDDRGRWVLVEIFAADRLHEAITRLYERYAELLPAGPLRERAAATARSVAVWNGPIDPDRLATALASSVENADHRRFGTWSARGPEEYLRHWRLQDELVAGWALRDDAVLAIEPNAFLVRRAYFGTARSTGGAFENLVLALFVFGSDGLVTRTEIWEPDCEAEALARFEALAGPGDWEGEPPGEPWVAVHGSAGASPSQDEGRFGNLASRTDSELFRCFNGRDWEGVLACVAPVMVFDERRRLVRNTCDREVWLAQFRFLFDVPKSRFTSILRATRGERLALNFHRFEGEVAEGGGPLALEGHFALHEVDADGRIVGLVLFDLEDEDAAHAELDARFEAGEGAAHPEQALQRRRRRALEARDWDAFASGMAPDFTYRDHRLLGWGTVSDLATFVRMVRSTVDLAPDARYREDHVRLSERGALTQMTLLGTRDGGAFESPMLRVVEVDALGKVRSFDTYDLQDLERALARFEEIDGEERGRGVPPRLRRRDASGTESRGGTPLPHYDTETRDPAAEPIEPQSSPSGSDHAFENSASRAWREVSAALRRRDAERFAALHPPAFRYRDHRRLVQLDLDRDGYLAFARPLLEMRSTSATLEILATRGERLALVRPTLEIADDAAGPNAVESLLLIETDERGAIVAYDRYEIDDEEAARIEIQSRWESGEGSQLPTAAWMRDHGAAVERRDWDAVASLYSPDIVGHDHRLVGWGTLRGRTDFLQTLRSMEALSPDARMRGDHVRACPRGSINSSMWVGTRDGGAFESPFLAVAEIGPDGMVVRIDFYDPHHFERALARFEELRPDAPQRFANAATATVGPVIAHMVAHDWQGFEQLFAESFRMSDRRRVVQLDLDRDQYVAFTREIGDGRAIRAHSEIVATRGERLALTRSTFEFTDGDVGPSEVAFLLLTQVDARGQIVAYVRWDLEDLVAARAELDARWAAQGAAEHPHASKWLAGYLDAFAVRDWTAMAALFAPDLVGENHRLVGWGTRHGPAGVVSTLQAQIDLAPDTLERVDHVRTCDGAVLLEYAWHGTREGGAFENLWVVLVELAGNGRAGRADVWEPEQLDQARARFAEIAARDASVVSAFTRSEELRPDPLRIPPNLAARTWDLWCETGTAGNWEAHRALLQPSYRADDRRRLLRTVMDIEAAVVNDRHVFGEGWRPSGTLLATAGDRLALRHLLWAKGEAGAASEVEMLSLDEVDAEGRFVWSAMFDPDDRAAAEAELFERHAAGGGDGMPRGMGEYFRGVNGGDLALARSGLCDDFVLEDRRRTGLGRLEGGDAYIASIAAAHELTGELHVRPLYTAAIAPYGRVVMIRVAGTNTEGGAFESYCAAVVLYRDERIASFEFFEPEELDAALSRLAECRPAVEAAQPA